MRQSFPRRNETQRRGAAADVAADSKKRHKVSKESRVQGVEQECLDTLMLITFFNILHKHLAALKKKGEYQKKRTEKGIKGEAISRRACQHRFEVQSQNGSCLTQHSLRHLMR